MRKKYIKNDTIFNHSVNSPYTYLFIYLYTCCCFPPVLFMQLLT